VLALLAPDAVADRRGPGGARAAGAASFATLDRQDAATRVGVSMGTVFYREDGFAAESEPSLGLRFDAFAQFVSSGGLGGYVTLPFSRVLLDAETDRGGLGNLEIGAVYALLARRGGLVLRAGMTLPTVEGRGEDAEAALDVGSARIADLVLAAPESSWLRLSISPFFRHDVLFLRGDLGVDAPLREPEDRIYRRVVRYNVGAGLLTGALAFSVELANTGVPTVEEEDEEEHRILRSAALSARFVKKSAQPSVSLIFPVDEELAERVSFVLLVELRSLLD
jgi:hypothetical protein